MSDSIIPGEQPRSIPTVYRERVFRSHLEAQWAYVLDHQNLEWRYEPRTFKWSDGWYLPDFQVYTRTAPRRTMWLEIKPESARELLAVGDFWLPGDRVNQETGELFIAAFGLPGNDNPWYWTGWGNNIETTYKYDFVDNYAPLWCIPCVEVSDVVTEDKTVFVATHECTSCVNCVGDQARREWRKFESVHDRENRLRRGDKPIERASRKTIVKRADYDRLLKGEVDHITDQRGNEIRL